MNDLIVLTYITFSVEFGGIGLNSATPFQNRNFVTKLIHEFCRKLSLTGSIEIAWGKGRPKSIGPFKMFIFYTSNDVVFSVNFIFTGTNIYACNSR